MSDLKAAKKSQTASSTSFQLTMNQIEVFDDVKTYIESMKDFQYGIACEEIAPSTGHKHIHLYVQFGRSVRLSLKKICGSHVEKCRGSPQQNVAYIKKDGNIIWEKGEMKRKGGITINEIKDMDKEQRNELPAQLYNIVNKINNEEAKSVNPLEYYKNVEVYYVYGDSGVGKTKWCIDDMVKNNITAFNEIKYDGSFWHGVSEDCNVCLYDDWRDGHMKPSELINFIDYNRHVMNIKGGTVRNNYSRIYITSVQDPEEIYKNVEGEPRKQWLRRMKKIKIEKTLF